jgi:large subunit ribosomal protein L20
MARATNSPASRARRKKVLKAAKGYFGRKSKLYRYATEAVKHAQQYAFRDRRAKKRTWRNLWTIRLNAACRSEGMTYSRFMEGLKAANITIDRRVLSEFAVNDVPGFQRLVATAREALKAKPGAVLAKA